jgi:hypothetical protein
MLDIGIALPPVGIGRLGGGLRLPAEAAKEPKEPKRSPDRRQVLRSGLPPGGLRLRFAPSRDPLKRNSHTLVRLCSIDKDASSKEIYCDIFATINRHSMGAL